MAAPLAAAGLLNSLLFSGYTLTLKLLRGKGNSKMDNDEDKNNFRASEIIFASTVGTLFQLVPAIPIELIKIKLQTQSKFTCSAGPFNCAVGIVRQNGLMGFYRGGAVMFWRDLIGYFFYIPAFELFRRELKTIFDLSDGTGGCLDDGICELLAGGLAGSLSWWMICPFELVKNRLQANQSQTKATNWRHCCLQIYSQAIGQAQGNDPWKLSTSRRVLASFYRGGLLLAIRAFPVNACVFYMHFKCLQLI